MRGGQLKSFQSILDLVGVMSALVFSKAVPIWAAAWLAMNPFIETYCSFKSVIANYQPRANRLYHNSPQTVPNLPLSCRINNQSNLMQSPPQGVWGLGFGVWGLGFGVWGL